MPTDSLHDTTAPQHTDQDYTLMMIGHELRTPLSALTGLLELLSRCPEDRRSELLRLACRSSGELMHLLDSLLELGQAGSGQLRLEPAPVHLPTLLDNAAFLFDQLARDKGLQFTRQTTLAMEWVSLDAIRLRQILHNLLSNAIKFTCTGGLSLITRCTPDGSDAVLDISVVDTGIGIDSLQAGRLMLPFSEAGETARRQHGGHGIGLSLCLKLAELMGGTLTLQGAPGRGTTARLQLRCPVCSPWQPVAPDAPRPGIWPADACMLVVDDHLPARMLLQHQLARLGVRALGAENGHAALRLWARHAPEVLMTDRYMPGMDGIALTTRIRRLESRLGRPRTLILGLSAQTPGHFGQADIDMEAIRPASLDQLHDLLLALRERAGHCLSLHAISMLSGGDLAFEHHLLEAIRDNNQHDWVMAERALEHHDATSLAWAAHRLAGLARLVCHDDVARQCTAMETAARRGTLEDAARQFEKVRQSMQILDMEIARKLRIPADRGGLPALHAKENPD